MEYSLDWIEMLMRAAKRRAAHQAFIDCTISSLAAASGFSREAGVALRKLQTELEKEMNQ
jgi:hypothetical protein